MSFANRLRDGFAPRSQGQREHDYLSQSTSLSDLERRQREIDRGVLRIRRFNF